MGNSKSTDNQKPPTTIDDLPYEILEKILMQLSYKDIASCSCVCKPWQSMIQNPTFIGKLKEKLVMAVESTVVDQTDPRVVMARKIMETFHLVPDGERNGKILRQIFLLDQCLSEDVCAFLLDVMILLATNGHHN